MEKIYNYGQILKSKDKKIYSYFFCILAWKHVQDFRKVNNMYIKRYCKKKIIKKNFFYLLL